MTYGRKTGGRVKGTPNRLTSAVRDMIFAALVDAGGRNYLAQQAHENPTAFLALLGKLMPRAGDAADAAPMRFFVVTGVPSDGDPSAVKNCSSNQQSSALGGARWS